MKTSNRGALDQSASLMNRRTALGSTLTAAVAASIVAGLEPVRAEPQD